MSGPPPVLPYGRQWVSEEDVEAVAAALRSDWLTTGPAVPRFERALAEAVGVPHAVVLNSGTAALHAMYAALGVGPGDEVVTSPLTFAATANAAHYLGARVRFVDVEPRTGNLDPERLDAAIGDKTRLVVSNDRAKDSPGEALRAKIANLISGEDGETLGVIVNKCRPAKKAEVEACLNKMVDAGQATVQESVHYFTKKMIKRYIENSR
jgi:hypothetical protein